jgi:hypothetical protein
MIIILIDIPGTTPGIPLLPQASCGGILIVLFSSLTLTIGHLALNNNQSFTHSFSCSLDIKQQSIVHSLYQLISWH